MTEEEAALHYAQRRLHQEPVTNLQPIQRMFLSKVLPNVSQILLQLGLKFKDINVHVLIFLLLHLSKQLPPASETVTIFTYNEQHTHTLETCISSSLLKSVQVNYDPGMRMHHVHNYSMHTNVFAQYMPEH